MIEEIDTGFNDKSIDSSLVPDFTFRRPDYIESGNLAEFNLVPKEMSIVASDNVVEVPFSALVNSVVAALGNKQVYNIVCNSTPDRALSYLHERVNQRSDLHFNLTAMYQDNKKFRELFHLIRAGYIVSEGFDSKNQDRLFLETPDSSDSVYMKEFGGMKLYKNIPVIASFSRKEINTVVAKQRLGSIRASQSVANYYGEMLNNTDISKEFGVKADAKFGTTFGLSDLEIASQVLRSNSITASLQDIKAEVSEDRYKKICRIVETAK